MKIAFQEAPDDSANLKFQGHLYTFTRRNQRDSAYIMHSFDMPLAKKYKRKIEEACCGGQMAYRQITSTVSVTLITLTLRSYAKLLPKAKMQTPGTYTFQHSGQKPSDYFIDAQSYVQ
ncbi:MAG: hypothetical protein IPK57_10610 [Chitinophagaceae bacterium]|nr:hypothetical protein [Chitinophagaceae bacterium]